MTSNAAVIVILSGIPGSGKTSVAERLVVRLRARFVSRDLVRAAMFVPCSFTDVEKHSAFKAVIEAVDANCKLGLPTVVEGMPFSRDGELEAVRECGARHAVPVVAAYLDVPVEVAQARVAAQRAAGIAMADDRDEDLVTEVAGRFRALPNDLAIIDGTLPLEQIADAILKLTEVASTAG